MIRQLAIIAIAAVCFTASTSAKVVTDEKLIAKAPKVLYNLMFNHFKLDHVIPEFKEQAVHWNLETELTNFDHDYQVIVGEFLEMYKSGSMLPRGQLSSIYYDQIMKEIIPIFKLFYKAPNAWVLAHVAYWVSTRINEYQFFYGLSVALIQRTDTQFIPQPRPYQVLPEFFFNTDVMKQIYDYKMNLATTGHVEEDQHTYVVLANYTNWYITDSLHYEYQLNYFMEDIDLNTWYFYFNQRYPFWLSGKEYPNLPVGERGEIYYFAHKMLLNRYLMERLSFDLKDIEIFDWDKEIMIGYSPEMTYPNGLHFPTRREWTTTPVWMNKYVEQIEQFESRIADVTDSGYMLTKDGKIESIFGLEGINILGNLIQGNFDSLNRNFYGSLDTLNRRVLGFSPRPQHYHQILPSALEHTVTSLRDPMFYRFYAKILNYFARYQERLGPYTKQQLAFDGVAIESANIVGDNLYTYMELSDSLVEKFSYANNEKMTKIKARQYRLNHKSFAYNLFINSQTPVKASVRVFLAPKYNVFGKEFTNKYERFVEFDYFVTDLVQGKNAIVRNSTQSPWFASDYEDIESFENIVQGEDQLTFEKRRFGMPARLLLPRGKPEGMDYEIYIYVSKFEEDTRAGVKPLMNIHDNKPFGYPLDRPMYYFNMPNMYTINTKIFHKEQDYGRYHYMQREMKKY